MKTQSIKTNLSTGTKLASMSILIPLSMTACQTAPNSNTAYLTQSESMPAQHQSQLAKTTLIEALRSQRTSSYAYHVNVLGSNDQRRADLANATSKQLAMSDDPSTHCEHVHDEAYADLLTESEAAGVSDSDPSYAAQKEVIKNNYLSCSAAYDQWYDARTLDEYSNDSESSYDYDDDEYDYEYEYEYSSEYNENDEFLPGYDSAHTKLDARKANLIDAYLFNPTSITASGVYRPLRGKISIAPNFAYQSRNISLSKTDLIYVDAKKGEIYIWADTLALILSNYFDKDLGLGMQNKWLKLDLVDDSLPDSFAQDLIMAHIKAKNEVQANSSHNQYRFLSTNQLLSGTNKPDDKHAPYLNRASVIIEQNIPKNKIREDLDNYTAILHDEMTQKYPQLLENNTDINPDDLSTINSLAIFQNLFSLLGLTAEPDTISIDETEETPRFDINQSVDYAVRDSDKAKDKWVWRNVYGLDNQRRITWFLAQRQMDASTYGDDDTFKDVKLEALTRYSNVSLTAPMFESLPEGAQMPNNSNTIDAKAYFYDLLDRYDNGEGTVWGEMILDAF